MGSLKEKNADTVVSTFKVVSCYSGSKVTFKVRYLP